MKYSYYVMTLLIYLILGGHVGAGAGGAEVLFGLQPGGLWGVGGEPGCYTDMGTFRNTHTLLRGGGGEPGGLTDGHILMKCTPSIPPPPDSRSGTPAYA
eukprot:1188948-Prorocentrum_minimum.AAC.1